ncbi:hypothetical protein pipiens_018484, partial [Culex pipiens pipiens]
RKKTKSSSSKITTEPKAVHKVWSLCGGAFFRCEPAKIKYDTTQWMMISMDCTLAAEGKFLKAHKVVLSACSPYFAALLSQQYDKHPIFILKDVKFQELRAMMDYMYRGEVNISQDQLAALLKAAESLQIKGLSDNRGSSSSSAAPPSQQKQQQSETAAAKTLPPPVPVNKASGLTIENKRPLKSELHDSDLSGSREGSTSPTSRKRKKVRRGSVDTNNLTGKFYCVYIGFYAEYRQ